MSSTHSSAPAFAVPDDWFRTLVELSLAGIYVVQDGHFVYVNPKLAEIFGYAVDEVVGLTVGDLVAPEDRELVLENIRRRMEGEVESLRYSFTGQRKDGGRIEVEVHGSRTTIAGRPAVVGVLLDVTRQRRAEEERERLYREAQRAAQAREEVLAVVSHDLRNPLNAMTMGIDMLVMQVDPASPAGDLLRRLKRTSRQMAVLIEDLLDASAMEAGQLSIVASAQEIEPLVDAAVELLQPLADQKEVRLSTAVAAGIGEAEVDAERVLQVLSNLGGNAIKFTPQGGTVELRVEAAGPEVRFAVSDSGPGIDPADQAHLFDRFWRAAESGERGAGLGLGIAKGIVEAHGGRIWVESRPGRGSTFFFSLPRRTAGSAAA